MMFRANSTLAALAIVAVLSGPGVAAGNNDNSDKADRRVAALITRAGVHNNGSSNWASYTYNKGCNGHSPAGGCDNRDKNNGWGNGNQDAPGNSECRNNAENAGGNTPGSCLD